MQTKSAGEQRQTPRGGALRRLFSSAALAALVAACSGAPSAANAPSPSPAVPTWRDAEKPPGTSRRPVVDQYHGVASTDDYRWLEDSSDPAVQKWVEAQNRYTRKRLDALPGRALIQERVKAVFGAEHPRYQWIETAPGRWFAKVHRPPAQQPVIVV